MDKISQARIDELEKENAEWKSDIALLIVGNHKLGEQVKALETRRKELETAFLKHARHNVDCPFLRNWIDAECNCGLFAMQRSIPQQHRKEAE